MGIGDGPCNKKGTAQRRCLASVGIGVLRWVYVPFGYVAYNVNWFEAAGVPVAAFDDFGRENPYPLVRVQAKQGTQTIASLDTVMPISGEAECQICHAAPADGGNGEATGNLATVTDSLDDPAHGFVPDAVSIEWASDLNILRLHDQKHGTSIETPFGADGRAAEPVACQRCHYTPALDLAQVDPSDVNGRDQLTQKTMSNVMHSHHASTGLFPNMPPAIDGQGNRRSPTTTTTILEETCYRCHPGKRTQCMRGAMANGGLVCQDCHGPTDASLPLGNNGPHGMHAIVDLQPAAGTGFLPDDRWNKQHRNYRNQGPGCESCHGSDLRGTVLSRTADDRTVLCKDNRGSLPECKAGQATAVIPKGTPVGCGQCHRQK